MKQIVVLGGGYGGVLTAKKLAKNLKKQRDIQITLIDKKPFHTLLTELHEVVGNRVEEDSIKVELKKIFAGFNNVEVVLDEITDIRFDDQELRSDKHTYPYDYLVIGTGSKPTFWGTPGAEEHTFTLWSYEDAVRLKEQIITMFRKAVKERNPELRREMLTFVVVGAGFTGIEVIGEIAEYVDELCKEFYVERSEVNLHVVDIMEKILPILPDALIKKAENKLSKLGVNISIKTKITSVTENGVGLGENSEIRSQTVIWTAGVEGSDLVGNLDVEKKERKRIQTNDKLQTLEHENVYVVGDNIYFIPEGHERPVPQMVENAEHAAPLIAHNITANIKGKPTKSYKPTFHGTMVCIGSKYGVAYVGTPKKMFKLSGFFAMGIKHLINMVYLFQICGFNKVYSYMLHEFFSVKNNRSFVGGHFAKRSPNFWLVPLRLFLGIMWLWQGLEKLPQVLKDPTDIFLIPAKVDGISGATADATSGATWSTAEAASGLPVPSFIESIVSWSMDLIFYNADGSYTIMASIFQTSMVVAEIIFGLLLIAGLFTAVSAVVTLAMGVMIYVSGMAYFEMLWYMIASIALIGGSGSTLGLDYYVLPWLKDKWKKVPIVKRWYLYTD